MGEARRRLVLLRHGQTAWNAVLRIQGQTDVDLDTTGLRQAAQAAPRIAALEPAVIVSSDLTRARCTAETVAAACGVEPSYDARLREFHLGERQGLTHAEYAALDAAEFARFHAGDWSGIPGAEEPAEVAARYRAALSDLAADLAPGETGVAVSHGAAIRTGMVAFLGWPAELAGQFRGLDNCARVVLEERAAGWKLAGYNLDG